MDGTVLIADDDRTIRTVLTQALTRAGCNVHATSSLTTLMRWISEGKNCPRSSRPARDCNFRTKHDHDGHSGE